MEYSQGQTLHESRIVLQQSQNNSISRRIVSLPATRCDMQEAVCVLLDRFNSVFMQSINTNPESNKLLSIFKCVAWLVFELLDLHPFSDGNGRLCRLLCSYVLSTCTPFPTPIYNLHTDHEFEKFLIAGRKTRHPSTLTSMIIESSLVAWDYAV